jgi:hypothetical protein
MDSRADVNKGIKVPLELAPGATGRSPLEPDPGGIGMTERKKKLIRDIESLRESIRLAGPEFVRGNPDEARQLLKHIGWCLTELTALRDRLTPM